MKFKRITALLLAALLIIGLFAGCSKDGTKDNKPDSSNSIIDQTQRADTSAKYSYLADYLDLTMPFELQYINSMCAAGTTLYMTAYKQGTEHTYTDADTGYSWSYYDSELTILSIDPDTGVCAELPNLQLPTVPEDCEGSVDCYNMLGSEDGTLWMLVNLYATKFDLPEDFDPETDDKWNYPSTDMPGSYLMHVAADGTTLANIDLLAADDSSSDEDGMSSNISSFAVDAAGNLYASDYNNIFVLDGEGKLQFKLDASEYGGSLCQMKADQVGVLWYNYVDTSDVTADSSENGRYFVPIDLEAKAWGEKQKMPVNTWTVYPGDDTYDFYYENNSNIFGYSFATDSKDKLVDWMACDVDTNNMYNTAILSDGRVAGMTQEYTGDTTVYQLIVLHRVDASEVKEKTVLTLACMGLDWDLRSQIVEYNKSNEQYRINVIDYSEYATDTDYTAGVTKLTTEIISGSIPDLFLTSSLPVDKYAAKGVIADLYTFMDQDSTMTRDYFVPQVLKALEKDGKLYELPNSFAVQTAFALSSIAEQYDIWNVAAVQDAMTQLQDGATVFSDGWTKTQVLSNCLSRNLSAFVDWTTGKCTFDSEAFQQLLAFCNSFPDEVSSNDAIAYAETTVEAGEWESDISRIASGKQLMATTAIWDFSDYIYNTYSLNGKITFTGYPTEDGKSGNSFYINCPLAISSTTKYPDAAWDFVKTMVQKTAEDSDNLYAFPISQAKFDEKLTDAMTEEYQLDDDGNQVDWDGDGQPDLVSKGSYEVLGGNPDEYNWEPVYALTQADADQILGLINATTGVYDYDTEILDIVSQEVSAYFAGDKDVKTTADMIQSRVNLYVQEQR